MSALAFPTAGVAMPSRRPVHGTRRHLVAVPELAVPAVLPTIPPAAARAEAKSAATPLRLTSRGRGVLVAFAVTLAAVIGAGAGVLFPSDGALPEEVQSVTVQPGDSLWTIANGVAEPGEDVRVVVEDIMALNALAGSTVRTGQQLTVPAGE